MDEESSTFGLSPDKLARLWDIGSDMSRPASGEGTKPNGVIPEIEGYEIIDKLGEGGMGIVWRGQQLSTQREVALKVLSSGTFSSQKALSRFEREVELAARLTHPNIARVYDSGLYQGLYYYAMELIEGQQLDEYVEEHGLTQRQILELMQIVCQAVQYAHQVGVIHRDLKPSNILVTEDGQPHVLDFGLAKTFRKNDSDLTLSIDGEMLGTLPYMSPEQATGQAELIDVRTDVYSLGIMLYRMLTGEYPYDTTGPIPDVLQNIQNLEPIRPRQIVREIDSDVEAILLKALAKDPNQRYQSSAELRHDIECWLKGLPIVARSISSMYLLRKIIARHRYGSIVVGLVITIIFGFSITYYHLYTDLRVSNAELQVAHESLNEETKKHVALANQVGINLFLQAWQNDDVEQIQSLALFFDSGTREAEAVLFLLNPKPLAEKVTEFRRKLGKEEHSFAEFIIAEHYLKGGNQEEAERAYRKCLTTTIDVIRDEWLTIQIKSRLYELSEENQHDQASPNVKELRD